MNTSITKFLNFHDDSAISSILQNGPSRLEGAKLAHFMMK